MAANRRASGSLVAMALAAALVGCDANAAVPHSDPSPSVPDSGPSSLPDSPDVNADGDAGGAGLTPGTYHVDPDGNPLTPLRVHLTIPADGWRPPLYGWRGVAKEPSDPGTLLITITEVANVAQDGCAGDAPADPPVGPEVDDFADALASLAPFEVTSDPADVSAFGFSGVHLELTVPDIDLDECFEGNVHSWVDNRVDDGPFYGYGMSGTVEEIWLLDVEGTRLMIAAMRRPGATPGDISEMEAILDSIRIET